MRDAVPGTLTIFSHRVTVVRVLGSKFLLYHFGRNTTGTLIEPVYPIKEPAFLSPWRFNIRKGPGTDYDRTKFILVGIYTITEVSAGQGSSAGWGRLKSGAGWISLDYVKRI